MPLSRGRALVTLAAALAAGDISLDPGADRDEVAARLLALPGIGPWTAGYIRMRALSDPDVFLPETSAWCGRCAAPTAAAPGHAGCGGGDAPAVQHRPWRPAAPWRSYAVHHLWATLEPPRQPAASRRSDGPAVNGARDVMAIRRQ